jgi:hypothetical protein
MTTTRISRLGAYSGGTVATDINVLRVSIESNVDTKGASGQSDVLDSEELDKITWIANFDGFTGGTSPDITYTWQHSADNSNWFAIASEAALTAAGIKTRLVVENTMRYLRIAWVTTGSPTTATTDFYIQAR